MSSLNLSGCSKQASGMYPESRWDYRRRWLSLMICCLGTFLNYLQSSIFWVSLWPYLIQADPSTPDSFFGLLVSSYSFGCAIASPVFGNWSSRFKVTRQPIIAGYTITIFGNLLLAFVETFPIPSRRYVMLMARLISGVGAGNNAVNFAYLAHASTVKERSKVMSYQAAFLSGATLLGPSIAAALTTVGYPGLVIGIFRFNMYTLAAYVCILFAGIVILLFAVPFKEYNVSIRPDGIDGEEREDIHDIVPVNKKAAICCISIYFVLHFCTVFDDTVGSAFSMAMFNWTPNQAVLYNGIILAAVGVGDFLTNIFLGAVLLEFLPDRTVIIMGVSGFSLYYAVSYSWPGLPSQNFSERYILQLNGSMNHMLDQGSSIPTANISSTLSMNTSSLDQSIGCNFDWCSYTTRIYLVQYIVSYVFVTVAFPCAYTATNALFSKVLGSGRQGTWQGVNSAVANIAMTISPIVVGEIFEYHGPRVVWGIGFALLMLTNVFIIACWKHLLPTEKPSTIGDYLLCDKD